MAYAGFSVLLMKDQQAGCHNWKERRGEIVKEIASCKAWQAAEDLRVIRMESGMVIACDMLLTRPVTLSSAAWTLYHARFQVPGVEHPRDHSERWNGLGWCH